jgi:hypothetical protein
MSRISTVVSFLLSFPLLAGPIALTDSPMSCTESLGEGQGYLHARLRKRLPRTSKKIVPLGGLFPLID